MWVGRRTPASGCHLADCSTPEERYQLEGLVAGCWRGWEGGVRGVGGGGRCVGVLEGGGGSEARGS